MLRFEFSLDVALRWRQSQLDVEELKLRRLSTELADLEQREQNLQRSQAMAREHVQNSAVSPAEREGLAEYLRWARSEGVRLGVAATDCRARIGRQRAALVEARRRYELLSKLKTRRHAEWEKALAKEIEGMASEAFLSRWNRK